jgi:hypothetical protein
MTKLLIERMRGGRFRWAVKRGGAVVSRGECEHLCELDGLRKSKQAEYVACTTEFHGQDLAIGAIARVFEWDFVVAPDPRAVEVLEAVGAALPGVAEEFRYGPVCVRISGARAGCGKSVVQGVVARALRKAGYEVACSDHGQGVEALAAAPKRVQLCEVSVEVVG